MTKKQAPPRSILPVLERVKNAYILWTQSYQTVPKIHRYTLAAKIDILFIEIIEAISAAAFLAKIEKGPYVRIAIRKLDAAKVLLMMLWETKSLDNKKYASLSGPLDEVGKMLGGWNGQLQKQNSFAEAKEK